MMRFVPGILVTLVLVLVAASYPTPVAVGSTARPSVEKEGNAAAGGVQGRTGSGSAKASGDPADSPSNSKERASQILSRLKPKPEQVAAKSREPAVELPKRIRISAIGVDAAVEFVGLASDGAMDVPKDADNVAWYRLGPRPGERGNAVMAGHVDWGGKTAVFWRLSQLRAGDIVEITAADDRKFEFTVQWLRWYEADKAPVEEVFGQGDATEITLITCGGAFDRKTRQYLSRIVVRGILR